MGDVTLFGNNGGIAVKDAKKMAQALKQSSSEGARNQLPDGGVYISYSGKRQRYSIGTEGDDANRDELWLVNIFDFQRGYICWKGGAPVAKRLANIYSDTPVPAPDAEEHGPFASDRGEGWHLAKSITLKSLERGIQGLFQTNTKSAVSEFSKLEESVADRMAAEEPAWPIISLDDETFTAQGQKNGKPVLKIKGWLGDAQVQELAGLDPEDIAGELDRLIADAANGVEAADDAAEDDEDEEAAKAAERKKRAAAKKRKAAAAKKKAEEEAAAKAAAEAAAEEEDDDDDFDDEDFDDEDLD